jgi:hypothetical protein|tara:strand:- start:550 stop:864 length:315 start_codon:yes stop_codon:yes gene_type:complete
MSKSKNGIKADLQALRVTLVAYAKQETLEPLKGLGRYLIYGLAGICLSAIGVGFLLMALLRGLQQQTSVFGGRLSFAPYLLAALAAAAVLMIWLKVMSREKKRS